MIPGIVASVRTAVASTLQFHAPLKSTLVLDTGAYDPTFVRATTATVVDFEGLVKDVNASESRHQGARRVENLFAYSEDFSNAAWTKINASISGEQITATGANAVVRQGYDVGGEQHVLSVWLRRISGSGDIQINADWGAGWTTVTLTGTYQRFSVQTAGSPSGGTAQAGVKIITNGDVIEAKQIQCEKVEGQANQNPSEYVSADVESTPYHGANVDGVQYFENENGNTVASNVVTEATGSAIADATLKGYLNEEQRTNRADNADDLTGGADTIDLTADGTGDFTLSVTSDAAVTVAAGTATGTGFGQAVAGTPVTFNLSVTGTVTLTLDSGTLTQNANGSYEYNLEKGSFATSWIPNTAAGTTRNADVLTYDYQPAALLGSLVFTTTALAAANDAVALGHNASCIWQDNTPRESDDGTNQVVYGNPTAGTAANYGLSWDDGGTPEVATYKDGSQVNTGSLDAGGFAPSTDELGIGCRGSDGTLQQSATYRDVKFWTDAKDQTFMEAAT